MELIGIGIGQRKNHCLILGQKIKKSNLPNEKSIFNNTHFIFIGK